MKPLIPARLAANNEKLNAQLPSSELQRFTACVDRVAEKVCAELEFGPSSHCICHVGGQLRATVWHACQRCLEPAQFEIETALDMHLVASDQAAGNLSPDLDPFVLSGAEVSLADLIEDALIMALPMVPRHDDCRIVYPKDAHRIDRKS